MQDRVKELEAEVKRLRSENERLREIAEWFCDRVERGEARSVRTYERFKRALRGES